MASQSRIALLDLPGETIDHILSHLPSSALVQMSATCHLLRIHTQNDLLWKSLVLENWPHPQAFPAPFDTWKDLYKAHHPFWFLPKHKLWFSDHANTGGSLVGQIIIARYDHRTGCIEGYRMLAEHLEMGAFMWGEIPGVVVHTFTPRVFLFLDEPVLKLDPKAYASSGRLQNELPMPKRLIHGPHSIRSSMILTRAIPKELQTRSMALWPPRIFPAVNRVRSESPDLFRGTGHRPTKLSEMSDTTFRIRKWVEFGGAELGVRMGEDVMTFSSLPTDCYTPTKEKPWQGIWIGDYSTHGCEFLVVIQRDKNETMYEQPVFLDQPAYDDDDQEPEASEGTNSGANGRRTVEQQDPPGCTGRLEAIKLTGDPNVRRGEYTWIAEDIGHRGLVRVAEEPVFKNARIVRSWGHVATQGFVDDSYIPSQLIMINHDNLAQYWEDFGHVSYYTRINIDDYLDVEQAPLCP
ncbi:MAG: hypothetical protein MMC33_003605 [Icmadophila ericetorum]|nr:hypothetical protein [Icmadophila ericetorum]